MTTAIFIITFNNRATKLLNRKYIVLPCNGIDSIADISQLTQGVFKVRRPCQSTIMGAASAGLHHSDRALRTAQFEKGDFKIGIKKNTGWIFTSIGWMCTHSSNRHSCSNNLKNEFSIR